MSSAPNPFLEFQRRYGPAAGEDGPVLFVREVFGVEPDEWQAETLRAFWRAMFGGATERGISIRSCHGVGKTAVASWLVWYMLVCVYPQKSVATAPSKGQLEDALVVEIGKWYGRLPEPLQRLFTIKKNRIELTAAPEESFFSARTARDENPEALQGIHSDHVLLLADEASGVPEKIFEAAVGSMSGHHAVTVLLGNPVRTTGFFFDTHHKLKSKWFTMHVTGVPGTAGHYSPRVSPEFVEQVADTYGRDTNAFRIRALGEFPKSDQDTIIPFELIEGARQRDIVLLPNLTEIWGLDVARFGDDSNVLIRRNRLSASPRILEWGGVDLMKTAGRVKAEWDALPPSARPQLICVDAIGLGAGVADRLRELGLPVRAINVSENAAVDEKYRNIRTELWFAGRDWLHSRGVALPKRCECGNCDSRTNHAEQLAKELALVRFDYMDSSGKIMAEPKKAIKKRGFPSPNFADAFLLTFAAEHATLVQGPQQNNSNWSAPLRRRRSIV